MKRLQLHLVSLILILARTQCLPAQDDLKTGKLDLTERIFDFGVVPREARVVHVFPLKNIGNDTLRILEVKLGCSCTTAPIGKMTLAPGDTTSVPVTFNTDNRSGNNEKGVDLKTDMKPRGVFPVKIKAYVESPTGKTPRLYAEPRSLEFAPPSGDKGGKIEGRLINNFEQPLDLRIVDYTAELGTVALSQNRIQPGKSAQLFFDFKPNPAMRMIFGSVTIDAYSGEELVIRYTVPLVRKQPPAEYQQQE